MIDTIDAPKAQFTQMKDGTEAEWQMIFSRARGLTVDLPERLLEHLSLLRGDGTGFAIDRLEHSLQTATRAHRQGESDEYVVCALFHDIGDTLGPLQHADIAAAILKPYVSEENHWTVLNHTAFQSYYFLHHMGMDRNARDQFRGHPFYDRTARFCEIYDQNSFDPQYDNMSLDDFLPIVRNVIKRPTRS